MQNIEQPVSLAACVTAYAAWTKSRWVDARMEGIAPSLASELVMLMGLGGESAEVVEELMRSDCAQSAVSEALLKELGDTMYYWARIADTFGFSAAQLFLQAPLASRDSARDAALHLVVAAGQALEVGKKYVRDGALQREKLQASLESYARHWRELCRALDVSEEAVLLANHAKVEDRFSRGTLRGSGNDR